VDKLLTNTTPGKIDAAFGKSFLKAPADSKGFFQGAMASLQP